MKNFTIMILVIALIFIFIKCSSETKEKKQPQTEFSDSNPLDLQPIMDHEVLNDVRFYLAYNFEEGKEFQYRLTTLSTTERDVESDSVVIDRFEQKITRVLNFKILSVEKDNLADIECTIS